MKTKLLLLFLVATNFTNAQVTFNEGFETSTVPTGWFYSIGFVNSSTVPCSGNSSLTRIQANGIQTSEIITSNYVSNGNQVDFSFKYKLSDNDPTGPAVPTIRLRIEYAVNNGSFNLLSTFDTDNSTCLNYNGVIPASAVPFNSNVKIRVSTLNLGGYYTLYLDDFIANQGTVAFPFVSNFNANAGYTSSAINYIIQPSNNATSSVINYGVSDTNLNNQTVGFSANGTVGTSGIINLTGLLENTIYFYQIVVTNSNGTTSSNIGSFKTSQFLPISEYTFNNTLNNINGNTPFTVNSGGILAYDLDRNGIAHQSLRVTSTSQFAAPILNLPIGNAPRTVSLWVVAATFLSNNVLFGYGSSTTNNSYGFSFTSSTINNFGWSNDLTGTQGVQAGWRHVVCTYDENGEAKVYLEGNLVLSGSKTNWNTSLTNFTIGKLASFQGAVDDLKIFNRAITATEVANLFNYNTLLSQNFNQNNLEVSLYPNPANNVLNIEMTNEVKSIEIYNIQGQKVKAANQKQINVSDLASGMYMIRIQDTENAVSTKKFMKQ
uniref:T9SS type A sorting domain-containing protein n=1 Tax=Flavobacterium sp. TaxID=239 RepID=UPI004049BBD4